MKHKLIVSIILILVTLCFAQNSKDCYSKDGLGRKRIVQKLENTPIIKTMSIDHVVSRFGAIDFTRTPNFNNYTGEIVSQLLIGIDGRLEALLIKDNVHKDINKFIVKYLKESRYRVKVNRGNQPIKYSVMVKILFSNGIFSKVLLEEESLVSKSSSEKNVINVGYIGTNNDGKDKSLDFFEVDKKPVLIKAVPPVYPDNARKLQIEGKVVVTVIVDETGRVISTTIFKSVPDLDEAARDAASKCLFYPAYIDGKPVKVKMNIPFDFHLRH